MLCNTDKNSLIARFGYDEFWQLVNLAEEFVMLDGKLYKLYADTMREIPSSSRRVQIIKDVHVGGGHVGISKTY